MLSVLTLAAESGNHTSVPSLRSLMTALTETATSLRLAFAANTFEKAYVKRGRFSSALGMPITASNEARNRLTATAMGNGYIARFRSGTLVLDNDIGGTPEAKDTHEALIKLVAIECRAKQETADEIIGSVGSIRPSDKGSGKNYDVTPFGEVSMGPKGQRIIKFGDVVYQGSFANINLACSLVEKDSGNTTKYREAFAKVIQDAAAVGGAAAGVPAEALAGGEDWMRDLSLGLSNIVFDLLGADDDPYNAQTFEIKAREMTAQQEGQLQVKTLKRDDDPQEVPYTHRQIVSGTDDGGDYGEYGFYFIVETRPRPEVPEDFE